MINTTNASAAQLFWVNWTETDIQNQIEQALALKKEALAEIKQVSPAARSFKNTVYALESSNYALSDCVGALEVLLNTHPSESIRIASRNAIEQFQREIVDIEYDPDIYLALKQYAQKGERLVGEKAKLFADIFRDYRRMGFELSPEDQAQLKANLRELGQLETEFSQNINEYKEGILVAPEQTGGLSEQYLSRLRRDGQGNYLVSLDYPEYFPFIEQADSAEKRAEIFHKNLRKGGERNIEILKRVLFLREQNAKLLGYESHAAFKQEIRMAKDPSRVSEFLDDLKKRASAGLQSEFAELKKLKVEDTGDPNSTLAYYDRYYYYRKLKTKRYLLDNELLKEYFPLEKVRATLFDIYGQLFKVRFEKVADAPIWEKNVDWYQVVGEGEQVIGNFALDFYPRPNKYGHAAVFPVRGGRMQALDSTEYVSPVCVLVCNFPAPTESLPSLLSHEEVETLFHEFGHVCHNIFTQAQFLSHSGTSTARDFVEAPSQMLENWVWDSVMLKKISGHYTGATKALPDELIEKLIATRFVDAANFVTGQVLQARLDLTLHQNYDGDPSLIYKQLMPEYFGISVPEDAWFVAGFGHLMGYDAGYYGYLWSKVYASDMFTRFQAEGLLNPQTGAAYRETILARGSSREELDSVRDFLGRDPSTAAFFKDLGLV